MNNENGDHRIPTVQSLPRSMTRGYKARERPQSASAPKVFARHSPRRASFGQTEQAVYSYARRTETLVAFTSAKTLSPGMRFIFWAERVVMIDAISPMVVSTITSLMTLSDTMLFTVPGSWFRMLSSIRGQDSANRMRCQWSAVVPETGNVCGSSLMRIATHW